MKQIGQVLKKVPGIRLIRRALRASRPNRIDVLARYLPCHGVGAEIGVHLGDFSEKLLHRFAPRELHLIDPWHYEDEDVYAGARYGGQAFGKQQEMDERFEYVEERFAEQISSGVMKIHREYSNVALTSFPHQYFDWIYIDGNHLFEFVKKDIEISLKKVKSGGVVGGDDYRNGGWWRGGVRKAVDEIAAHDLADLVDTRGNQFVFLVR